MAAVTDDASACDPSLIALQGRAADARDTPTIGVFDHARGAWTRKVSGDALHDLDEGGRMALLRTLLSDSRQQQVPVHDPYSFALYATLAAPGFRVAGMFETGAGSAVAFTDTHGHSIAALSSPKDPAARGVLDLKAYGTDVARQRLLALVEPWRTWSLPSEVEVEVDYRQRPDGQPAWRARDPASAEPRQLRPIDRSE